MSIPKSYTKLKDYSPDLFREVTQIGQAVGLNLINMYKPELLELKHFANIEEACVNSALVALKKSGVLA